MGLRNDVSNDDSMYGQGLQLTFVANETYNYSLTPYELQILLVSNFGCSNDCEN